MEAKKVVKHVQIPTVVDPWPVLTILVPMSETMWGQMMTMLEVMKPALVKSEASSEEH